MTYFMIYNSDGDTRVIPMSREELLERINPDDEEDEREFYEAYPGECDPNYWDKTLIIKGEVVSPEPVERVTEWEIP